MTASWVDEPWLALDTETTGVDVFADRVVEVAAVEVLPDGTTGDTYTTIINPGVEIPTVASDIHGITTARAIDEGITPAEAITRVADLVFAHGHRPVVMFNAVFDWPILICEAERHGLEFPVMAPVLDPLCIDRMVEEKRRGKRKLFLVAQHYGVAFDEVDAHGALADAVAAARVMRAIIERHPKVGERSLASVYLRQVRGHERWRADFVDYMRRQRDPGFDIPPGWPIPALVKGGLPVVSQPAEAAPAPTPPGGEGEEVAVVGDDPATSDPASPARHPGITASDVARYATTVFRKDYDDAPKGDKTRVVDRLRHALVWAMTDGQTCSLNDLAPDVLGKVHSHLRWIADGQVAYSHDADGVTFVLIGSGEERDVRWADLETNTAA